MKSLWDELIDFKSSLNLNVNKFDRLEYYSYIPKLLKYNSPFYEWQTAIMYKKFKSD